jgi:hypothetical protein
MIETSDEPKIQGSVLMFPRISNDQSSIDYLSTSSDLLTEKIFRLLSIITEHQDKSHLTHRHLFETPIIVPYFFLGLFSRHCIGKRSSRNLRLSEVVKQAKFFSSSGVFRL